MIGDILLIYFQSTHLPGMKDACRLQVAARTIENREFIDILSRLGKAFVPYLDHDVINRPDQQEIQQASADDRVLHLIRMVK